MDKVIQVRAHLEPLNHVKDALSALLGAGVAKMFDDGEPFHIPPAQAIEVNCDVDKAGYAKAGFYAAGFEVPTATGPAVAPAEDNPMILTVTPSLPDTFKNYPLGPEESGTLAAKALRGAFVTLPIGPNGDPYLGDNPGTSMQVRCNSADVQRVTRGFAAANFIAE
jgi:hypothetical protein